MSGPHVSVCMATFNGASFVREQIESILADLEPSDELLVVDDGSVDDSVGVVASIEDPRITLFESGSNHGHVRAFETVLGKAHHDVIMLADQDDLWPAGRREVLVGALARADVAAGNYQAFGTRAGDPSRPLRSSYDGHPVGNVIGLVLGRRPYFGCCMALRRDFRGVVLPFPKAVEAHDHWLAIVGNVAGRVAHVEDAVTVRRLHSANLTPTTRRALGRVVATRLRQLVLVLTALGRRPRGRSSVRSHGKSQDA